MKKRLLSILLALCMVVSLFTVTAFAAAPTVATVGDTPYTDLQTALKNANGGTVKLCADITYKGVYQSGSSGHWNGDNNYELSVNNTVTLDLNGYTIKSTGGSSNNHFVLICVGKKGNLTICDSSALQTGKIICDAKTTAAGKLISTVYNNGSLTVTGGTISNTVPAENNTCYAIESVTVESTSVSISGDAVISSTGEALRVYSQGSNGTQTASISGGTFIGSTALRVPINNSGEGDTISLSISGGTFTGTKYACRIESYTSVTEGNSVSVSNGTFNGEFAVGETGSSSTYESVKELVNGNVTGGSYTDADAEAYAAADSELVIGDQAYVVTEEYPSSPYGGTYKTINVYSAEGLMWVAEQSNLTGAEKAFPHGEGYTTTINICHDIDMAGYDWTPINGHWVNINGNGHTISNLNCVPGVMSGFVGYGGACRITDLKLENVTASGNQVGAFIAQAEGGFLTDCTLSGDVDLKWADNSEYEIPEGVGAMIGVNVQMSLDNVSIDEDATVIINKTGMESEAYDTAFGPFVGASFYETEGGQQNGASVSDNADLVIVAPDGTSEQDGYFTLSISLLPEDADLVVTGEGLIKISDNVYGMVSGNVYTITAEKKDYFDYKKTVVADQDVVLDVVLNKIPYGAILGIGAAGSAEALFSDVDANAWYYDAVQYVLNNGLMNGVGEDTFAPNGTMTRAMVWTVLGRMAGQDFDGTGANWYVEAQNWAIVNGISDGTNPNGAITREELVTMLWRFVDAPVAAENALQWYGDEASVADWAADAMNWAVNRQIIEGANWNLNPQATALRCQVAAILMRYCG